jgi:hypothetical protein
MANVSLGDRSLRGLINVVTPAFMQRRKLTTVGRAARSAPFRWPRSRAPCASSRGTRNGISLFS